MIKLEFYINDIPKGEFSLGIYTCEGEDENGSFKGVVIGLVLFEIWINKY